MLSCSRLKDIAQERKISMDTLANHLAQRGGFERDEALTALRNWFNGLHKPKAKVEDIQRLADGLGVEVNEITEWKASYKYAPTSPSKARLVSALIAGRPVQDALDLLKFTHKRAASMVSKTLSSAIASAAEKEADVEKLFVKEARVDGAGRRIGTKGFRAKDRGRAHAIFKQASHIHITVAEE